MRNRAVVGAALLCLGACVGAADAARVLLLGGGFGSAPAGFSTELRSSITRAGWTPTVVEAAALRKSLDAESGSGTILVLPDAVSFPAEAKASLLGFLKRGNHLVAVSGPAFSRIVVRSNGRWVDRVGVRDALAADTSGTPLIDIGRAGAKAWRRATSSPELPTSVTVAESDAPGRPQALHVKVSRLDHWDNVAGQLSAPFPDGRVVTTFVAKGGPNTPELLVEWDEKDGTRWTTAVKLAPTWKRYALLPEDFNFWPDGSPANRGKAGDRFRPSNAGRISFGLADGLTRQKLGIAHEYWVADLRAGKNPFGGTDFTQPLIESISPEYKVYRTTTAVNRFVGDRTQFSGGESVCAVSRSKGFGASTVSKIRYIPVIEGYDKDGRSYRGAVAHMLLNTGGEYAGSVWGYVGAGYKTLAANPKEYSRAVVSMMKRIDRGAFLASGGCDQFAYLAGEQVKLGARVMNLRTAPIKVLVGGALIGRGAGAGQGKLAMITVPARTIEPMSVTIVDDSQAREGEWTARVQIDTAAEGLDSIEQPFEVVTPGRANDSNTVIARDGDFYLNGKKWYGFGMNYWPLYSAGQEPSDYWLHWLAPEQYDPVVIERDLALAKSLGMNLLSIQYGKVEHARCLVDFLARCSRHGLKANVFVTGLDPISHDLKLGTSLIAAANLGDDPAVFAYDLGWEVHIGPYDARRPYDGDWQQWVIDRYGSVDAAVKDWGYRPQTVGETITGPSDDQLVTDGEWRVYVAAYRRFWDDKWSKGYQTVRAAVRSVDERHMMGARSGWGGLGAAWVARNLPVDLLSGARNIDFISPEGYAIGGDKKGFLRGGFDNEYGRYWSANKPIYWAEYGNPLFGGIGPDVYRMSDSTTNLDRERDYYKSFLSMVKETYANASAGWWWPGGLRVDEKSDYGIINPDGTPRPAALEFTKVAAAHKAPRTRPQPTCYLTMDRDEYINGFTGIYEKLADKWVDLFMSGQYPGLKTPGTGTTSVDAPLMAVGNVPYNGQNPPKYLNAEFDSVKVNGRVVQNGDVIEVTAGAPVRIEAVVGNTAEARWIAAGGASSDGAARLLALVGAGRVTGPIAADAPFLGTATVAPFTIVESVTAETAVTVKMTALNRCDFGEVVRFTLKPAQ